MEKRLKLQNLILLFKLGKILCYFGYHRMIKGVAWSKTNRYDECIRKNCNHCYWVQDLEGKQLREFQQQIFLEKRRVLIEKVEKDKHNLSMTNTDFFNRMMGINQ